MTDTVVITFPYSRTDAERIAAFLGADVAEYTADIFSVVFSGRKRIVALMSMGIVVRKIAPLLVDKWMDPAIVVVSPDLRFAVPVLGGHHGANELAKELAGLGIMPVITTATESRGRDSVETIAERTDTEVLNRDSTRQVNAALLHADIPVHSVQGPAIVLAGPDVSILVKRSASVAGKVSGLLKWSTQCVRLLLRMKFPKQMSLSTPQLPKNSTRPALLKQSGYFLAI
jgi:cobalt-precorrin 5A hydrolase